MSDTKEKIVLNFDKEVHDRLKITEVESGRALTRFEKYQWAVRKQAYSNDASFNDAKQEFTLTNSPSNLEKTPLGKYTLVRNDETYFCNFSHPLMQTALSSATQINSRLDTEDESVTIPLITFNYSAWENKVTLLEPFVGKSGWLAINQLTLEILSVEDHFAVACLADDGSSIPSDTAHQMLEIIPTSEETTTILRTDETYSSALLALEEETNELSTKVHNEVGSFLVDAYDKLDDWADDISHEHDIKENWKRK